MGRERSAKRTEFLASILWEVACNNGGYGGLRTKETNIGDYDAPVAEQAGWFADMVEMEDPTQVHRVTIDTIAHGVSVITGSELKPYECTRKGCPREHEFCDNGERLLHNAKGERLYLNPERKRDVVAASMANEDECSAMDIIHYLAIVECGIYDRVVYG